MRLKLDCPKCGAQAIPGAEKLISGANMRVVRCRACGARLKISRNAMALLTVPPLMALVCATFVTPLALQALVVLAGFALGYLASLFLVPFEGQ